MNNKQNSTGADYLTSDDIYFLLECLKWGKLSYDERSIKYRTLPVYIENEYKPKMKKFNEVTQKLRGMK